MKRWAFPLALLAAFGAGFGMFAIALLTAPLTINVSGWFATGLLVLVAARVGWMIYSDQAVRDRIDEALERLTVIEDAWDETFTGPEPLAITDADTDRIPVVEADTAWHPPVELAAGKRARPRPHPEGGGEQVARPERGAHRKRRQAG